MESHRLGNWRIWPSLLLTVLLCGAGGCSIQEAVVDGFYGGISDTVAEWMSALLSGVIDRE